MIFERQGKYDEALAEFRKARDLYEGNVEAAAFIGYINAVRGNKIEAQKSLDELQALSQKKYVTPFAFALIYIALNERERAVKMIERAYTEHDSIAVYFLRFPQLESLLSEAQYRELHHRLGLSDSIL